MTCLRDNDKGADLLIGYLEHTLAPAERKALEAHAAECADCRGLLAVQAELDDYEAPAVSAGFDAKLYARIAADEAKRPWRPVVWPPSWRVYAPAVAVAAMLAVTVWVRQPSPQAGPVDPEVQQLEQALDEVELLMPLGAAETL